MSIDISESEIPCSVVPTTWLSITSTIDECVVIPSRTPTILHFSIMLIGRPIEYEISTPFASGDAGADDGAPMHHDARIERADRVELEAGQPHTVESHMLGVLDVDAVLAADDRHVLQRHVVGANDDSASDDSAFE